MGWYKGTSPETRATFKQYSGMEDERKVAWEMIRVGMASVSHTCIFCFQDILSLGNDARMNTPGVADGANANSIPPISLPSLCASRCEAGVDLLRSSSNMDPMCLV